MTNLIPLLRASVAEAQGKRAEPIIVPTEKLPTEEQLRWVHHMLKGAEK